MYTLSVYCIEAILSHSKPPLVGDRQGLMWLGPAVSYIRWQRWDNDNCQTRVALLMCFPGHVSESLLGGGGGGGGASVEIVIRKFLQVFMSVRGIPNFLIFDPIHKLCVLIRKGRSRQ